MEVKMEKTERTINEVAFDFAKTILDWVNKYAEEDPDMFMELVDNVRDIPGIDMIKTPNILDELDGDAFCDDVNGYVNGLLEKFSDEEDPDDDLD